MKEKSKHIILVFLFLFFVCFLVVVLIVSFSIEKRETEYLSNFHSLKYYELNVIGKIDSEKVNLNNYINVIDYSESTGDFSRKKNNFSEYNMIALGEYRYYIDNEMLAYDMDDADEHHFFVNNATGDFNFCYKVTSSHRSSYWYVRKGYVIPNILTDHVKSVMIVPKNNVVLKNILEIPRLNTDKSLLITDIKIIDDCITAYEDQEKNMEFLKEKIDVSFKGDYIVLAVFDNDTIYQFLGYLQIK